MNGQRFDDLARSFSKATTSSGGVSRRGVLKVILASAASGFMALFGPQSQRDEYAPSTAEAAANHTLFLPEVFASCETPSTCKDRHYCKSDQSCLCLQTAEGDIRCGVIPTCDVQTCTSSADCANLGAGYFCDTPNSGCCTGAAVQRCIEPCRLTCPPSRVCGANCCALGYTCLNGICCQASQVCGSTCCPADATCVGGVCCPAGRTCGTKCCPVGQVCVQGVCVTSSSVCPSCGTCKNCNINSSTGQYTCTDCSASCSTASVCSEANQQPNYVALANYLHSKSFVVNQAPQSLILNIDGAPLRTVLGSNYTNTLDATQTAVLYYGFEATGEWMTYAIVIVNNETQYALIVSNTGAIIPQYPAWARPQQGSPDPDTGLAIPQQVQAYSDCGILCGFACAIGTGLLCQLATGALCAWTGPGVILCGYLVAAECAALAAVSCLAICDQFVCKTAPKYCFCNNKCYSDTDVCLNECHASLSCFTGICKPAKPSECVPVTPPP